MAIESQKIISVSTEGAVQSVRQLKDEISSLRDAWLNAEEGTEEYDQITEKLIEDQTKLNNVMRVGKNEASAATGSYNALVNEMGALKRVWRETTSEVQRQALGDKIRVINDQLKELDESIGNNQRKVGSYEQALKTLNTTYDSQRQELTALKTALDNLEPGTEAYNNAFERAAEITHNLQERQEMLRMSANDFGTQLSNVANIGAGLVGSFNAVNGILTLTGQKSENLEKAMADLQAGIAIVQGLKGIDGLVKSLKGYVGWAAKAYDTIRQSIAGRKAEAKQIQATTVAAEQNAVANTEVATSEVSAAAGATTLGTGMRTAAAGTTTATAAMTAFKAVLMSLGIGVVIAAISGLVTLLGKLGDKWLNAGKTARENSYNVMSYIDEEQQKLLAKEEERFEREVEMARAKGATEIEILQMYKKFYEDVFDGFITKDEEVVNGVNEHFRLAQTNLESYRKTYKEILENNPNKKLRKSDRKELERDVNKWIAQIKVYKDQGNLAIKEIELNHKESFDRIMEKGVKTYKDIEKVLEWYYKSAEEVSKDYKFNPIGANEDEIKAEVQNILKTAGDAVKTELQLENEAYQQQLSAYTWTNEQREILQKAHWKAVRDIVTGATQSILEHAKASNQTELQNLEDTYNKELKILRQYGRDTTQLTLEYEKNKAKIQLQEATKAIDQEVKLLERYAATSGPLARAYDALEAAGVTKTVEMMKMLAGKQNEIFEQNKLSLSKQVDLWGDLWEKYGNDEKIKLEERQAIYEKYINAKMALEKLETQHTLDQIKTRKQALDAEIAEIDKLYDKATKLQEKQNASTSNNSNFNGTASADGFWNYLGNGGLDSYSKQRDDENSLFGINKEKLQEQIDVYKKAANDMSLTEAERTAAKEKEVQARTELEELELEHTKKMVDLEKDQYGQLINTITSVGDSIASVMGSIYDTIESSLEYQVKAGKMTEDEANKQLENYRWLQYTQAVINTASGALGAYTQASSTIPPPYGQIVGAAAAAAVVAQGVAQIAAIKAASKSSSIDSSSRMQPVTTTPAEYEPNYTSNLTGKSDSDYLRNAMSEQKLYVSVTDINSVQSRVKTSEEESGF